MDSLHAFNCSFQIPLQIAWIHLELRKPTSDCHPQVPHLISVRHHILVAQSSKSITLTQNWVKHDTAKTCVLSIFQLGDPLFALIKVTFLTRDPQQSMNE